MGLTDRFARNLVEQREKARLTSGELAALTGLPRSQIESFETGGELPDLEALVKLAGALGISADDLYPMS